MFGSLLTLLLLGCLVQPGLTGECTTCTPYDATDDADCAKLKAYISCTFKADDGSPCTVPEAHRTAIAGKTCPSALKDTCKCEVDYYGKELGKDTICSELKTLDGCLGQATEQTGCGTESLSEIKAFATKTKLANTCDMNAGTMVSPKAGLILTTFISGLLMLFAWN